MGPDDATIGYYVHHAGDGHHLRRAAAFARAWSGCVTGLSSLPRPEGWAGPWIDLPRDDTDAAPRDATANGRFHWVPEHDAGLRSRMAEVASWVDDVAPAVMVVDVSVEVATFVRLLGVPVVTVVAPGARDDPGHHLALGLAGASVGFWPDGMTDVLLPGLAPDVRTRVRAVGGCVPRPDPDETDPRVAAGGRRAVLLGGTDDEPGPVPAAVPGWTWDVVAVDGDAERRRDAMRRADVVVTPAAEGLVAEVAGARRPAVVVPRASAHDEEAVLASALAAGPWPVCAADPSSLGDGPRAWGALLGEVAELDGEGWRGWCDGRAVDRFVAVVRRVVGAGAGAGAELRAMSR